MKKVLRFLAVLLIASVVMLPPLFAAEEPPVVVGRVYNIEGNLLGYVPAENDWVAVVRDAPFGTGDTLYSGSDSRAELIVPNGTWIRIGDTTQVQFIGLDSDVSEVDVASGVARFYNKESDLVIKATSPYGYVLAYAGSVFDFYVGENSAEVIALQGRITFVHAATNARYEISPGSPSILSDQSQVTSGEGGVDPDWDGWNRSREGFWSSTARATSPSVRYLPTPLRHEAYVFEDYGRWERINYDGAIRWFWRPTRVSAGWAPFTNGRWTEWYGDQTWIPSEPFGYVTHHYGNWIFVSGRWYWAPPVTSVNIGLPLLNIGFFWYPGRVSWIHSGQYVGWVPLAPRETYYSHHRWGGPHVVHVTNINITQINIHPRNFAYAGHAVIVPQRNFYTVNNYGPVRVTNINNTTIINNYRSAPVVNNTVINNYSNIRQRHSFANVQVREKPHAAVLERVSNNQRVIQQGRRERPAAIEQQVKSIQPGKINREARIQQPKVTNYIVPANETNLPKNQLKLQQREIRKPARAAQEGPAAAPTPAPKPGRPSPKPGVDIQKPGRPEGVVPTTPVPKPEVAAPPRPAPKPERVAPAKPVPAPRPEGTAPAKPAPKSEWVIPGKPVPKPEVAAPPRPAPKPERVAPAKPGPIREDEISRKPEAKPDRVAPVKPQPKEKPERMAPAKKEEPDQPSKKPLRGTPSKVPSQDLQKGEPDTKESPR